MIQTSYFANYRNFPDGKLKISISRFTPTWFNEDYNALELAPSKELLLETKAGHVSDEEYTKRYFEETLSKLDPKKIANKYKDSIFLCFESDGDFCHRHLVSEWLNENNINVDEIKNINHIYISVESEFTDYNYFTKVMDRFISNYKNIVFISDSLFVSKYIKDKDITMELFNEYDTAIVFTDNDNKVDFYDEVKKTYIVNGNTKKITIYK